MDEKRLRRQAAALIEPDWYSRAMNVNGDRFLDAPIGRAAGAIKRRLDHLDPFENEADAIKKDPDLTRDGKRRRLRELGEKTMQALDAERTALERVRREHADLAAKVKPRLPDLDPAERAILLGERRQLLAPMDPVQVELAYRAAIEADDALTIMAIEGAPSFVPWRPRAEVIEEGRRRRLEREAPEVAELGDAIRDVEAFDARIRAHVARVADLLPEIPGASASEEDANETLAVACRFRLSPLDGRARNGGFAPGLPPPPSRWSGCVLPAGAFRGWSACAAAAPALPSNKSPK